MACCIARSAAGGVDMELSVFCTILPGLLPLPGLGYSGTHGKDQEMLR